MSTAKCTLLIFKTPSSDTRARQNTVDISRCFLTACERLFTFLSAAEAMRGFFFMLELVEMFPDD